MSSQTRTTAAQRIVAIKGGVKPFRLDQKVRSQGRAGLEIAGTLELLHKHALGFALDGLAGLLELGLIEARRMVRRAHAVKTQEAAAGIDRPSAVQESLNAVTSAAAAAEIADVLVVLRSRAVEFDLKFLGYLLEMSYIEAFELSRNTDTSA